MAAGVVEGLAAEIDLKAVDAAGVVRGLQLGEAVGQRGDVGFLIADLQLRLQQADKTRRRVPPPRLPLHPRVALLCVRRGDAPNPPESPEKPVEPGAEHAAAARGPWPGSRPVMTWT